MEILRSLVDQGLVERLDLEGTTSLSEVVENVLRRLRGDGEDSSLPAPDCSGAEITCDE